MAKLIDYSFAIGKEFNKKKAESPEEYFEVAAQIHDYLETRKIETEDGIIWKDVIDLTTGGEVSDDAVNLSQYGGSSGALYYYLGLYEITKDEKYKELVLKAADYLNKNWKKQKKIARDSFDFKGIEYSFYLGIASVGTILSKVYEAFKREEDKNTIIEITNEIINGADKTEAGFSWSHDKSPLAGGGTVLYLYKIYELLKDENILIAANKGADEIIAEAIKDERGGYAWTSYAHPNQTRVPNFECGTAGIGYVLAVAYEISNDEKYLNAAKEAAKHIKAIAVKQGDGFLVPWHDNPDEKTIFYVSTCHGPAGTSRLFYQLYKDTKDSQYLDDIESLYKGVRHIGVPERQSAGYWNTVGICCGTAGVVQFFINYYIITGRSDVKEAAELAGSILLGQKEKQDKGVAWPLAFERVKPQNLSRGISYAAGASGVGVALIQLYLLLEDKYKWIRLFDDPYPVAK